MGTITEFPLPSGSGLQTSITYGAGPNPNFGLRTSSLFAGNPPQFQTPRQIRFGARFEF